MEQQYQNQNGYQQHNHLAEPVSFKEWMITMLLYAIPLVNIIMLFVWAFGGNTKISKANFAKAALVWTAIGIVLSILWIAVFGALAFNSVNELSEMSRS
ncbi:hypothetical protein SAMN04487969_110182 [Paenibacillus algorifonticola]|uniref:Uncharacterized protein n=1 Tax=Paenibacillus algorifonticola TaxID=684063 RepID=A0A1I2EZ84_9BACL|nr:hypothetical protein [Paenibacillus algorifonticola]SFE98412.1 hypothetical protein SAMN04487969_110182 [Paenibacillus algorifonticola]